MFYNLSEEQVNNIKAKIYPVENGQLLKSVVINSFGTDTSVKAVYSYYDLIANNKGKVFNNPQAVKYMKLKIFEILSPEMAKDVNNVTNIEQLEQIINSYGAESRDFNPSLDFLGDKYNADAHLRINDTDNIELAYETTFLLRREKLNFLSLGAVFYFDKQEYIKNQNVEEKFIDKRILFNKTTVYRLYENDALIENPSAAVQDLRLIKSTFTENSFLQNLANIINSDKAFDALKNTNRFVETTNLTNSNAFFNDKIRNPRQKAKALNRLKLDKRGEKYFSSPYFSRNFNEFLGLAFTIDYETILYKNTVYGDLISRSDVKKEFINKCKISDIKVLRRTLTGNIKNKLLPKHDTTVVIATSSEPKDSNLVSSIEDENGSISEISLNTSSSLVTRTFSVTDKNVFHGTNGIYQYGVQITVNNGINSFLNDHADSLMQHLSGLKDYLEETNKIARTAVDKTTNKLTLVGSYDPQKNAFTPEFIKNFANKRENAPSYQEITIKAAANFVSTLNLLGLFSDETKLVALLFILSSMLHPLHTSAESIAYFIGIYEKLIHQMRTTVKNNYNNSFTLSYWFTSDYVDTTTPIKVGYKYLETDNYQGLALITATMLKSRTQSEINRFSLNPNLDSTKFGDKQYSYLSPNVIYSKNKILSLKNLDGNPNAIANIDFAQLEIDIKNVNYYGYGETSQVAESPAANKKLNKAKIDSAKLSHLLSTNVLNIFKQKSDTDPLQHTSHQVVDDSTNATILMLALTKQFDLTKKSYFKTVNTPMSSVSLNEIIKNSPNIVNKIDKITKKDLANRSVTKIHNSSITEEQLSKVVLIAEDVPLHVNLLLDNSCALLSSNDNYKKSLELNSKFDFLFNAIHAIEILEYDSISLSEKWSLLTKEKISSLSHSGLYICRLRNYKNNLYDIDGMEQIKLPIYDQYFFFSNNIVNIQTRIPLVKDLESIKNKNLENIKNIFDKTNVQIKNLLSKGM